jgi:DNA-binding NarL/FixJ family response regulator
MVRVCSKPGAGQRPVVIFADSIDDSAARIAAAVEQCGGDLVRLRPAQDVEAVVLEHHPSVIVVDVDQPQPRLGIALADFALQMTRASVIVLGASLDRLIADRAELWASRCFWLQQPVHEKQLATTLRLALLGQRRNALRAVPAAPPERRRLRPREREIAELLLNHYRVPAVAERLSISAHTVRNHLKNLYRRWGIRSQQELLLALREAHDDRGAQPREEEDRA